MQNLNMFFAYCHARVLDIKNKDEGATAVEYGLLVALIAIVMIVGISAVGTNMQGFFSRIAARFLTIG